MKDAFDTLKHFSLKDETIHYYDIQATGIPNIDRLPYSLKVLLENQCRHSNNPEDIQAFAAWLHNKTSDHEIAYRPARVLMQDFTGVPAVVDLAAMRNAMITLGGKATDINPLCPVDLVIDHSVQVDQFGTAEAFRENVRLEMARNQERYTFLKWGQGTFDNFQAVPPGTGICHQVNLEYLAKGVWSQTVDDKTLAYPDTLVGTDSHTTMVNGLGVLGWGVGGIEAEAAMLGQPVSMLIPEVIGFRFEGNLNEGITATDLVLKVTEMLRLKGVVGKFVEFFGPGLKALSLADRATLSNMAPEYGATCGLFPIDQETIRYLELSNRDQHTIELVQAYTRAQGMWHDEHTPEAVYTDTLTLDLTTVVPSVAGPRRPQDRVTLSDLPKAIDRFIKDAGKNPEDKAAQGAEPQHHGDVVIAAITSCTNTSNPSVMLAAGLLAKKAVEKGLTTKAWVKSSLAPGSKVVTDYLKQAALLEPLETLGFYLVGYGCTTCIGNSGPLNESVSEAIRENDLIVSAVLSGNRNFEGRIHPLVKANWLASPPLVVAYALAGTTRIDLSKDSIGTDDQGNAIYLKDIWPSSTEIHAAMHKVTQHIFAKEYQDVYAGDEDWQSIHIPKSETFDWQDDSTYVKFPPFFDDMTPEPAPFKDIKDARILALLGDSVTTDHISPAGAIKPDSPAGLYLQSKGIDIQDFNSYGSRRGNHEVMMRGTFANIRIRNEMLQDIEGGFTEHFPSEETVSIYDAAMQYMKTDTPLVVIAGKEYGTGSSRDWAAKGTRLLGVKAVIAESFERIHRSNLIGMGVLPLRFKAGVTRKTLQLTGNETITLDGIANDFAPGATVTMTIKRSDGSTDTTELDSRIITQNELAYYQHGGILSFVLRKMLAGESA